MVSAQSTNQALSQLLADASVRNRLPDSLMSYRANVETEFTTLLRREDGNEIVAAIEQVASTVRWNRVNGYHQRVSGYRTQQLSLTVSMLTIMRSGWVAPTLYGNRLQLMGLASDSVRSTGAQAANKSRVQQRSRSGSRTDSILAVHPLAADRDRYYQFSGGDTVVTMHALNRVIPIVHVRAQPRADLNNSQLTVVLFDGELDLDASSGSLVRMRGHFVQRGGKRSAGGGGGASLWGDAVAYIEYENAERMGTYWLPAKQRIELQAMLPIIGDNKAVIRIVSRFSDMVVNDTVVAIPVASGDSLRRRARNTLSYAPGDSMSRYNNWMTSIGLLSEGMHADDFEDIAPDRWRSTGPPRVDMMASHASDVLHFNRVEGFYTGAGIRIALRDAAPGTIVRANAGYAWAEQTLRGRLEVSHKRGAWGVEARGGRWIDNTNDFRVPMDSGNTIGALLGSIDPYDYVSRSGAGVSLIGQPESRRARVRFDIGVGDDRYVASQYTRSPLGGKAFRANRGVDAGGYLRSAVVAEWHPGAAAEFVAPGVGFRLSYERGDGTLSWQRMEARVTGRKNFGPFTLALRSDIGQVLGKRIPSQQLFELGKYQNLPGYEDKEFAGSRAAVLRAGLLYKSPFLNVPIRLGNSFWLPAISPGLSAGIQSGWTDAPTLAASESIARLGYTDGLDQSGMPVRLPVSRVTDGVRASVTAGVRLFGGGVFIGSTRPIDHTEPWKLLIAFGQAW